MASMDDLKKRKAFIEKRISELGKKPDALDIDKMLQGVPRQADRDKQRALFNENAGKRSKFDDDTKSLSQELKDVDDAIANQDPTAQLIRGGVNVGTYGGGIYAGHKVGDYLDSRSVRSAQRNALNEGLLADASENLDPRAVTRAAENKGVSNTRPRKGILNFLIPPAMIGGGYITREMASKMKDDDPDKQFYKGGGNVEYGMGTGAALHEMLTSASPLDEGDPVANAKLEEAKIRARGALDPRGRELRPAFQRPVAETQSQGQPVQQPERQAPLQQPSPDPPPVTQPAAPVPEPLPEKPTKPRPRRRPLAQALAEASSTPQPDAAPVMEAPRPASEPPRAAPSDVPPEIGGKPLLERGAESPQDWEGKVKRFVSSIDDEALLDAANRNDVSVLNGNKRYMGPAEIRRSLFAKIKSSGKMWGLGGAAAAVALASGSDDASASDRGRDESLTAYKTRKIGEGLYDGGKTAAGLAPYLTPVLGETLMARDIAKAGLDPRDTRSQPGDDPRGINPLRSAMSRGEAFFAKQALDDAQASFYNNGDRRDPRFTNAVNDQAGNPEELPNIVAAKRDQDRQIRDRMRPPIDVTQDARNAQPMGMDRADAMREAGIGNARGGDERAQNDHFDAIMQELIAAADDHQRHTQMDRARVRNALRPRG